MEDIRLVIDLLIALCAALLAGAIAQRVGLPVIVGYVFAGIAVGPNTPGFVADHDRVQLLANVGVGFLMFALGVEFSLTDLLRAKRFALITAGLQIPITIALGAMMGLVIGWDWGASLLLGGAFAISSSIVVIKLLMMRGELESPHGVILVGVMVAQDLSLVVLLALVPVLSDSGADVLPTLLRSLLTAGAALTVVWVAGTRLVPRVLGWIAGTGSRELFLVSVVVFALGTAAAAHEAGLSFALGAFLAGLVVSESEYDVQVAAQMGPLRDLFATLFFVAIGMLLEPSLLLDHFWAIVILVTSLVVGKTLIMGGAALAAGVDHWTATRMSLVAAQMGEFSFVLAGAGLADNLLDDAQYGQILSVALLSILVMPASVASAPFLTTVATRLPGVQRKERIRAPEVDMPGRLHDHVVICGFGRIGSELARSLNVHGIQYCVIDINPATVRNLRESAFLSIYGDAAEELVLLRAKIQHARTIAITVPDIFAATATVRTAKQLNPAVNVVTRVSAAQLVEQISRDGADEVVQPEFEAAMELTRRVLTWHDIPEGTATEEVAGRRTAIYGLNGRRSEAPTETALIELS